MPLTHHPVFHSSLSSLKILARKWDRLENQTKENAYDIFVTALNDKREEGIIDDIRDLRRYLMLVESEILMSEGKTNEEDPEANIFREERSG